MRTGIKLFSITLLIYVVYVTPAGGTLPNRYVDLVHSIVNEGRFAIDTYHENTVDKAYYNGHYYAGALPGPAFFAVPAYLLFKWVYAVMPTNLKELAGGIQSYKKEKLAVSSFYGHVDNIEFFLSQAFLTISVLAAASALGSLFLFKTVRILGYAEGVALTVALLYALATNVFFYSTVFYDHVLSATFGIAALYLVLLQTSTARRKGGIVFAAGLTGGGALLIEYPNIFISVLLAVLLLEKGERRRLPLYIAGFVFPVLVLVAYNWISFDNPVATPYMYETEANRAFHSVGFYGVTYPHLDRLASLLFSPERGLFLYAPITLVGLAGIVHRIWTKGKNFSVALFCAGAVAVFVVFYSSYSVWDGGAGFGPRFLIPMLPFSLLGLAFAIDILPRFLVYGTGFVSIIINWAGAQFGFAESPLEHVRDILSQGPTLPAFGAILTHSTNHNSALYLFAESYHSAITLVFTICLVGLFLWAFRDALWHHAGAREAEMTRAMAKNR